MASAPTFLFIPPPLPPFPLDSPSENLSPLELVLGFIAIITIPVLIYTIIFGVKCPFLPLRHGRQSSGSYSVEISPIDGGGSVAPPEVDHEKESDCSVADVDAVGSECPVCLSTLSEGEEIKRLSVCRHAFHSACIDMWLESHSNCPVCRASIAVKRPNNPAQPPLPTAAREVFLRQDFQHAADLV